MAHVISTNKLVAHIFIFMSHKIMAKVSVQAVKRDLKHFPSDIVFWL